MNTLMGLTDEKLDGLILEQVKATGLVQWKAMCEGWGVDPAHPLHQGATTKLFQSLERLTKAGLVRFDSARQVWVEGALNHG